MQCPACKAENPPAATWCSSCGATFAPPAAERKLVTALYADLVGHTALQTRLDPEDWWRFLRAYFAEVSHPIRRFGGTVEKFIGDAIFAVFGVPQSYEDDAERAVRAAVEMQEALARLNTYYAPRFGAPLGLRIGLSTGEAIAPRATGTDQLVTGELTNLAERLQSQGQPGSITLSEQTYRLVESLVDAEPLGALILKGFPGTQRAYVVRRLRAPALLLRGLGLMAPLIGREREIDILHAAGQRLRIGQGQVVCLIGEAGLGKSRLVSEFLTSSVLDATVLQARCHEFTRNDAYGTIIQHLRAYMQFADPATIEDQQAKLSDTLGRLLAQPVPEIHEAIAHLLGLDAARGFERRTRGLDPDDVRHRVVRAVAAFWEAAASRPLMLIAEDLHWMDSASAAALEDLVRLTARLPLMLLCVFRPERQSPAWEFKVKAEHEFPQRYREIRLEPLSASESTELARALLEQLGLAAPDLKRTVAERSEGNPLYVEELVRSLQESGVHAAARLPQTLQGILQSRLDALPETTREVLQTAAVIGRTFPLRLLQAATGTGVDLTAHLSVLQRGEFVIEPQFSKERQFAFKHVMLQEAAYGRLLREDRKHLHRRLAEIMAGEGATGATMPHIFHHFAAGEVWEKAVDYGERAAKWTLEVGASDEALAHYRQLAEILEAHPEIANVDQHCRLTEAHGDLLVLVGRSDEARRQYDVLKGMAATASRRAHAERKIAAAYRQEGNMDRAMEHLRQALVILSSGEDPSEEAWAHLDLGYVEDLTGGDVTSVLAHCQRAEALARGRDHVLNARVFRLFAIVYIHLGKVDAALESAQRAAEFAARGTDQLEVAIAHNNLADVYRHKGQPAEALHHVRQGLAIARSSERTAAVRTLAILHTTLGELHLDRGEWEEAQAALEQGLDSIQDLGLNPRIRLELLADLAQAEIGQNRLERALQLLDEAQQLADVHPLHRFVPMLLRIRAEVHLQAGDLARAEQLCADGLEAVARYRNDFARPTLLRVRAAAARAARMPDTRARSLRWLTTAVELLEPRGRTLELGRAYLELARLYQADHRTSDATAALHEARDCFGHIGARQYVEEIERQLAEMIQ